VNDLEGEIALFQMFLVLAMICPYSSMCIYACFIESIPSVVFSHVILSWLSQKGIVILLTSQQPDQNGFVPKFQGYFIYDSE